MAELLTPYYKLQAQGPAETGIVMTMRIEEGAGGPLEGWTTDLLLAKLRELLQGEDPLVRTALVRTDTTTVTL
ncbi:hypothetical protein [Streptomyces flaveolus]|uniref:hypothetical protein n=1 Tax=Streptomyces flaveolus TaxID=67297 RepID=UPI001671795A|nr:hypothetical protein [Streptomyces flaveolus]GGQ83870.1 hypothetical protein GCM10010216_52210 [Streptomyces flaveolus]